MDFIIISIIIISILVCSFVIKREKITTSYSLLIVFYLIILFIFLNFYAAYQEILWLYFATVLISSGSGYLLGGVIYLFVASLFKKLEAKTILLNLLPFFVCLLFLNIPFLLSNPIDGYFFKYLSYIQLYGDEVYLVELLVFFLFIYRAYVKTQKLSPYLPEYYSDKGENHVDWVKHMLWGTFVFILLDLSQAIYLSVTNDSDFPEIQITIFSSAFIIIYITYHGLYRSKIFIPKYLTDAMQQPMEKKNYSTNPLTFSPTKIDDLKNKLNQLLEIDKVYLNDSLTLSDLVANMSISEKQLSRFINQVLGTNFYELINDYRLKEFKVRILDPNNSIFSTIAIANQCGFKSKTSFYAFFKKREGKTPAQYLKQVSNP